MDPAAEAPEKRIIIEAPDDVFVEEVVQDGAVGIGTELIVLRSPHLERLRARLVAMRKQIEIVERPLDDGRVAEAIAELKRKAKVMSDAQSASEDMVKYVESQLSSGTTTQQDLDQAKIKAASAASIYMDTVLLAQQADQTLQDMKDRISATKMQLDAEERYLEFMDASMNISSAIKGVFTGSVAKGSFARKGHTLGTILA